MNIIHGYTYVCNIKVRLSVNIDYENENELLINLKKM